MTHTINIISSGKTSFEQAHRYSSPYCTVNQSHRWSVVCLDCSLIFCIAAINMVMVFFIHYIGKVKKMLLMIFSFVANPRATCLEWIWAIIQISQSHRYSNGFRLYSCIKSQFQIIISPRVRRFVSVQHQVHQIKKITNLVLYSGKRCPV